MAMYDSYPDGELVKQLRLGDGHAFTQIYQRYWRKLYTVAYDRLHSKQAAEDVVQEVLTSLWQRKHEVIIESLYAYLAAATKYAIFRQLSKNPDNTLAPEALPAEQQVLVDDKAELRLLEQMMQKEVNRLPEKCRLVFQYSRDHGLSNKEIAYTLQISQKTVEKHITTALRTLRLHLKHFLFFIVTVILSR